MDIPKVEFGITKNYVNVSMSQFSGLEYGPELDNKVYDLRKTMLINNELFRLLLTSKDLSSRADRNHTEINSYVTGGRVTLEMADQVIIQHNHGITIYKNRRNEVIELDDKYYDITLKNFLPLDPIDWEGRMASIKQTARENNKLIRLTISTSQSKHDIRSDTLISELTDQEMFDLKSVSPLHIVTTLAADIIYVVDRLGNTATIKDRELMTGYKIIRH